MFLFLGAKIEQKNDNVKLKILIILLVWPILNILSIGHTDNTIYLLVCFEPAFAAIHLGNKWHSQLCHALHSLLDYALDVIEFGA